MVLGTGLALWGLLFICVALGATICALFGVFYALKILQKNRVKSVLILTLSLLVIIPVFIFFSDLILPKKQLDINLDFESKILDSSSELNKLCHKLSGLDNEYYCSDDYAYNLKVHLPNHAEFRVKSIHLGFSMNPNSYTINSISFFNKSTYSINKLKDYFKPSSLESGDFVSESPVPKKISMGMLVWLNSGSDSANTECENTPKYRICIRASSLGGDYSLGYEMSKE